MIIEQGVILVIDNSEEQKIEHNTNVLKNGKSQCKSRKELLNVRDAINGFMSVVDCRLIVVQTSFTINNEVVYFAPTSLGVHTTVHYVLSVVVN